MSALGLTSGVLAVALSSTCWGQVTQRVSVGPDGRQSNEPTFRGWLSADARYIAFSTAASNLVPGDTNGFSDIFVRDRVDGTTERVSVDSNEVEANNYSIELSISADGRYVAFSSQASNLVPGDLPGPADIFVRDRQNGTTERVSVHSNGMPANGPSWAPSISADGRYVAFVSIAHNLVSGDTNGFPDVFLHDRQSGSTEMVTIRMGSASEYGLCGSPRVSADGRIVAFSSDAPNLVPGDLNDRWDVFVRNRQNGTTELVSVDSGGSQANDWSETEWISPDGRYVAFSSNATNLVPADTNASVDVFVRDRRTGTTERVSVGASGEQGDSASDTVTISDDFRYVAFSSYAANLVAGDTNGDADVFVRDRQSATIERVSVDSRGVPGNGYSGVPAITPDGRYVAFASRATNLDAADSNGFSDVFVHDLLGSTNFTALCDPGVGGVIACPCGNPPSGPGRGCNNSAGTGGAVLSASGGAILSSDSLVFTTSGEKPTSLSVVRQWAGTHATGLVFGQGVRCTSGTVKRMYTKSAVGGSITAPDFAAGDPQVSVRSAARGDTILAGQTRWYFVYYRDGVVLGGCPAVATFNTTQTGAVVWSP